MAQKLQVLLTCDLDEGDVPAVGTVSFGFEGGTYEFELCRDHLDEFNRTFNRYVAAARPAGARRRRGGASSRQARRVHSEQLQAMRVWARENGWEISDRGRIPAEVRDAYEKATR